MISSINIISWITPSFSSESDALISYHIYIENQHGQLLYNDITEDTFYELYNLKVCDIYTVIVIAHSGDYSSISTSTQDEYNEGTSMLFQSIFICIILTECYVIIASDHSVIFTEHNNLFNVQFHVTVSKHRLYYNIFLFDMNEQIIGYPKVCNSTLLGTTRENSLLNGIEIEHHILSDIVCSSEDCQSVTANYTVSNLNPLMNYIFIANILDHFNNSKTKNESYFSKYSMFDLYKIYKHCFSSP